MTLPEKTYQKILVITFYAFLIVLLAYLFLKYILGCILPFAVAFIFTYSTRKAVLYLKSKFGFKTKFSVFIITFSLIGIICTMLYLLTSGIISELSVLSEWLTEDRITGFISGITERINTVITFFLPKSGNKLTSAVSGIAQNLDELISSSVQILLPYAGKAVMSFFKALPSVFLFIGVSVLAMFYFGCDYEKIMHFVKCQLTDKQIRFATELKKQFFTTVFNVVRAYAILISLTFVQLLTGFLIAGIRYATLIAILVSLIDILPVLGTGTVLVPWSIVLFLSGNVKTGLCILILYVIITIVRQIAEPKILGDSVGLHPLFTLISMYSGVKLAGIKGLFLFPFALIIIKNLNEKGFIRLYKNPSYDNNNKHIPKEKQP